MNVDNNINNNIKSNYYKGKVAIIGGSVSGIASAKASIENGLKPTIFEREADIGGLWQPQTGKMWDTMNTNITRFTMSFSDFEFPPMTKGKEKEEIFPKYKSVFQFLKSYANHFNLINYIKFNSNVTKVERIIIQNENGEQENNWNVTYFDKSNGAVEKSEMFEFLIIANGIFSKPSECKLIENELKSFTGKIIFSQDYKNKDSYKDKNVLLLGTSFSSCEIAAEISSVTKKCVQVGRENQYILNRFIKNSHNELVPWDFVFFNRSRSYEKLSKTKVENIENRKTGLKKYCSTQIDPKTSKIPIKETKYGEHDKGIVVSTNYLEMVENNKITIHTGNNFEIVSSNGNSVTCKNELGEIVTENEIDEIIICNGYQLDLSFLPNDILDDIRYNPKDQLQPLILYENIFSPNFKNLAFITILKGSYFIESELYARWANLVFSNKLPYPNKDQFKEGIDKQLHIRNSYPRPQFPIFDLILHCDSIAKEIGCCPNFDKLKLKDPQLYDQIWDTFFCPASYRLFGEHSNFEKSKEIISNYNYYFKNFYNLTTRK